MIRASAYGRLGRDPIMRQTKSGKDMTTASLAVNAARYGEEADTVWISLAAFGMVADQLTRHRQGEMLAAIGPLVRRKYTGRDGTMQEGWSLTADAILSARTVWPGGTKKGTPTSPAASGPARAPFAEPGGSASDLNDSIPEA
jgi:single-strand DNA-binding protein